MASFWEGTKVARMRRLLGIGLLGVFTIAVAILGSCHSGHHDGDILTAAVGLRGDLDRDGNPSVGDAIAILRIVVGLDGADSAADADGDGSTSVNDAIAVLRCVVGLAEWPLGEYTLPPTRTIGPGVVIEAALIVGAEERVECLGETTIQCETATIAGELYSSSPTAAGDTAGGITIDAQGDVALSGAMWAGDGAAGDLSTSSGQGGDGGSVAINSANGDITVGVEAQTSADAPDPYLGAGDAGVGADDLTTAVPGPGGQGGSVSLSCPNGLLTIHPRAGLIHVGNGGDGGTGHVPVDSDIEQSDPPEDGPDGGNAGLLSMECDAFAGLEEQEGAIVIDPPEMLTGGNGGDGGGLWVCVEVGVTPDESETSAAVATCASSAGSRTARGLADVAQGNGGVSWYSGGGGGDATCPGEPGKGGDYSTVYYYTKYLGSDGVGYIGEKGGDLRFGSIVTQSGQSWPAIYPKDLYAGGKGGDVSMGGWSLGLFPAPCTDGRAGGGARAIGGPGGRVIEDGLPAVWLARMNIVGGAGGNARAQAGNGQPGGDCCASPPGQGGKGGNAGSIALATGGNGGNQVAGRGGKAGNATAIGADGGRGGNGSPPGIGGQATGTVVATAGTPGTGSPPGDEGATEHHYGEPGAAGQACPADKNYGVVVSSSPQKKIYGYPAFYNTAVAGNQVEPAFTLGGTNSPIQAWQGQSMIFSPDNSLLWAGNELGGMCLYRNPLTTSGDRAPDLQLHMDGTQWYSIWYEAQADILYATTMSAALIYAWDGASVGSANRPPDRTIAVPDYWGQGYLTGAAGSSVLFMAARLNGVDSVLVFDGADSRNGVSAPDRSWRPQNFKAANTHALSWDDTRNLLYVGVPNLSQIHVYSDASTREGSATPNRTITIDFPGKVTVDWITGVIVAPEHDLLFVSMYKGQTMVFRRASSLQGTPEADRREQLGDEALGLGVFRQ